MKIINCFWLIIKMKMYGLTLNQFYELCFSSIAMIPTN